MIILHLLLLVIGFLGLIKGADIPFTWAFDSMRKEIMRSRATEREAIENNKTIRERFK